MSKYKDHTESEIELSLYYDNIVLGCNGIKQLYGTKTRRILSAKTKKLLKVKKTTVQAELDF